jgi:lysine-specific demethylase 8
VTRDVERIAVTDPERLALRLEQAERPLLIDGGVRHWRALASWDLAYLSQLLGEVQVAYKLSSSNAHPDFRQSAVAQMFARGRAAWPDFLRLISGGDASERARFLFTGDEQYLLRRRSGQTSISPELAPLLSDLEIPALFPEKQLHTVWAWFSGPGVRTWLHYDNNGCHNLNAQVTGHKQCWLYAPEELARLHPFPLGGENPAHNCSMIDLERPRDEFAGDLAAVTAWHAELRAGDLLFIPAWWFHSFLHLGELNSNVNFWWRPERPSWNVVAARQALLDAAGAADLDHGGAGVKATLRALDAAALRRVWP